MFFIPMLLKSLLSLLFILDTVLEFSSHGTRFFFFSCTTINWFWILREDARPYYDGAPYQGAKRFCTFRGAFCYMVSKQSLTKCDEPPINGKRTDFWSFQATLIGLLAESDHSFSLELESDVFEEDGFSIYSTAKAPSQPLPSSSTRSPRSPLSGTHAYLTPSPVTKRFLSSTAPFSSPLKADVKHTHRLLEPSTSNTGATFKGKFKEDDDADSHSMSYDHW